MYPFTQNSSSRPPAANLPFVLPTPPSTVSHLRGGAKPTPGNHEVSGSTSSQSMGVTLPGSEEELSGRSRPSLPPGSRHPRGVVFFATDGPGAANTPGPRGSSPESSSSSPSQGEEEEGDSRLGSQTLAATQQYRSLHRLLMGSDSFRGTPPSLSADGLSRLMARSRLSRDGGGVHLTDGLLSFRFPSLDHTALSAGDAETAYGSTSAMPLLTSAHLRAMRAAVARPRGAFATPGQRPGRKRSAGLHASPTPVLASTVVIVTPDTATAAATGAASGPHTGPPSAHPDPAVGVKLAEGVPLRITKAEGAPVPGGGDPTTQFLQLFQAQCESRLRVPSPLTLPSTDASTPKALPTEDASHDKEDGGPAPSGASVKVPVKPPPLPAPPFPLGKAPSMAERDRQGSPRTRRFKEECQRGVALSNALEQGPPAPPLPPSLQDHRAGSAHSGCVMSSDSSPHPSSDGALNSPNTATSTQSARSVFTDDIHNDPDAPFALQQRAMMLRVQQQQQQQQQQQNEPQECKDQRAPSTVETAAISVDTIAMPPDVATAVPDKTTMTEGDRGQVGSPFPSQESPETVALLNPGASGHLASLSPTSKSSASTDNMFFSISALVSASTPSIMGDVTLDKGDVQLTSVVDAPLDATMSSTAGGPATTKAFAEGRQPWSRPPSRCGASQGSGGTDGSPPPSHPRRRRNGGDDGDPSSQPFSGEDDERTQQTMPPSSINSQGSYGGSDAFGQHRTPHVPSTHGSMVAPVGRTQASEDVPENLFHSFNSALEEAAYLMLGSQRSGSASTSATERWRLSSQLRLRQQQQQQKEGGGGELEHGKGEEKTPSPRDGDACNFLPSIRFERSFADDDWTGGATARPGDAVGEGDSGSLEDNRGDAGAAEMAERLGDGSTCVRQRSLGSTSLATENTRRRIASIVLPPGDSAPVFGSPLSNLSLAGGRTEEAGPGPGAALHSAGPLDALPVRTSSILVRTGECGSLSRSPDPRSSGSFLCASPNPAPVSTLPAPASSSTQTTAVVVNRAAAALQPARFPSQKENAVSTLGSHTKSSSAATRTESFSASQQLALEMFLTDPDAPPLRTASKTASVTSPTAGAASATAASPRGVAPASSFVSVPSSLPTKPLSSVLAPTASSTTSPVKTAPSSTIIPIALTFATAQPHVVDEATVGGAKALSRSSLSSPSVTGVPLRSQLSSVRHPSNSHGSLAEVLAVVVHSTSTILSAPSVTRTLSGTRERGTEAERSTSHAHPGWHEKHNKPVPNQYSEKPTATTTKTTTTTTTTIAVASITSIGVETSAILEAQAVSEADEDDNNQESSSFYGSTNHAPYLSSEVDDCMNDDGPLPHVPRPPAKREDSALRRNHARPAQPTAAASTTTRAAANTTGTQGVRVGSDEGSGNGLPSGAGSGDTREGTVSPPVVAFLGSSSEPTPLTTETITTTPVQPNLSSAGSAGTHPPQASRRPAFSAEEIHRPQFAPRRRL